MDEKSNIEKEPKDKTLEELCAPDFMETVSKNKEELERRSRLKIEGAKEKEKF